MRRYIIFLVAAILTDGFNSLSSAQISSETQTTAKELAGSVYIGPSMNTLRELTDNFGERLSGSPTYDRAVNWAITQFHSNGVQNVHTESFLLPNGWRRGPARGEIVCPISRQLHIESLGWAPSMPRGGVKAEVVLIDDISAEAIKGKASQIKGKIVMLDLHKIFEVGEWKAFGAYVASAQLLKDAGALAVLNPSKWKNDVLEASSLDWHAHLSPLPEAHIGMEDFELIRRSLEKVPVVVHLDLQNTTSGPITVNNVIAEIRGREKPNEWVIVGAHLDSWDFGTGAEDNGTGSVAVLEVARAIAALGKPPRRSIRFALWGGEEQGLLGSYAYVQSHLYEITNCIAVLNTDNGPGHPKGWKVEGRKDLKTALQPISDSLLKDLGGGEVSMEFTYDTDHGPFVLQGIPALDQLVDDRSYEDIYHKPADTFDKVDPVDFKAGEAILAATAWVLANGVKPIAPHIDHASVAEILGKQEGLVDLLTLAGEWKP